MLTKCSIFLALFLSSCAGWTVNGIPADRLRCAQPREYVELGVGVATSFLVHWLSHVAYLEATGTKWEQRGLREITYFESKEAQKWNGRVGFLGQLLVGVTLPKSWFSTGYHLGSFAEIASHPLLWGWEDSDLGAIGKTKEIEWAIYTLTAIYLMEVRKCENL